MFDPTDVGGKPCNWLWCLSNRKSEIGYLLIKHKWKYENYVWHRSDKTIGKILKDNKKNCRTKCDDGKRDKFIEN
jgi:hypothetical protein